MEGCKKSPHGSMRAVEVLNSIIPLWLINASAFGLYNGSEGKQKTRRSGSDDVAEGIFAVKTTLQLTKF